MEKDDALELVFRAIDIVNGLRTENEQVPRAADVVLVGADGALDSLALVTLILNVEHFVKDSVGEDIGLLDDADDGLDFERLRTPGTIADVILDRLPK